MKIVIKYNEKTNEAEAMVAFDKHEQTNFFDAMPYCMDALNDLYQKLAKAAMLRGYEHVENQEIEEDEWLEEQKNDIYEEWCTQTVANVVNTAMEEDEVEARRTKVRNIVKNIMKGRDE